MYCRLKNFKVLLSICLSKLINAQSLISPHRYDFYSKMNKRTCSFIWKSKVLTKTLQTIAKLKAEPQKQVLESILWPSRLPLVTIFIKYMMQIPQRIIFLRKFTEIYIILSNLLTFVHWYKPKRLIFGNQH